MSLPDLMFGEDQGHDPYNHVGKQIRRHEAGRTMTLKMEDKIFVMSPKTLDQFRPIFAGMDLARGPDKPALTNFWGARLVTSNFINPKDVV